MWMRMGRREEENVAGDGEKRKGKETKSEFEEYNGRWQCQTQPEQS